jgi:ATP adenylyltransferase
MGKIVLNEFSHLTAKDRDCISFPTKILLERNLLKGAILDYGCGKAKDVEVLHSKSYQVDAYDKYYFPDYPSKKYDTILCMYVLNVLLPEEQTLCLIEISRLLNSNGKAYFAVRRDIKYEGFRTHKIYQKQTYQCNVTLPYKSIFLNNNLEIYEYTPYNNLKNNSVCPFCNLLKEQEIIAESATVYAIFDKFAVNPGHVLIIPKKHKSNYFDLSFKEQSACWFMLNYVKNIIEKQYKPLGFNVGINIEEAAGQTIPHVHIHLIPRYKNDTENPRGGVRAVIPDKKDYFL